MIETALVYIYSVGPTKRFVGCGCVIEGELVATCRHVWEMAVKGASPDAPAEVEIVYPHAPKKDGPQSRSRAKLVDDCTRPGASEPDLVLVEPDSIPDTIMRLLPARHERFETGPAFARIGLIGRDRRNPDIVIDRNIKGLIDPGPLSNGQRQFTGDNHSGYWSERGASGSPVFVEAGEQLAGILSLAETGANDGKTQLHEASIVPATTIRAHLERFEYDRTARRLGVQPEGAQRLFESLSAQGVPVARMPAKLENSSEEAKVRAAEPAPVSNEGGDIDAAIGAARERMSRLDVLGANELLDGKIADEEQARKQRLIPLLAEKAAIARIAYDYDSAKATLRRLLAFAPDEVWHWIELGDICVMTGQSTDALTAFRGAADAARRNGDERDLSVSFNKIGNVQVARGDLAGALKSFSDGLAIRDRLAKSDPGNAGWQRDLSVSFDRIGDVQVARGDLTGALKSFSDGLAIADRLAKSDPGNAGWQRDLSVSYFKLAKVFARTGDKVAALDALHKGHEVIVGLTALSPDNSVWKNDLDRFNERIAEQS